jgi:hypothetical protein
MTMKPPAFAAVAVDYVHQMVMDFEPDRTAKAAACCHGFGLIWGRIHFAFSAKALFMLRSFLSAQVCSGGHTPVEFTPAQQS